MKMNTFATEIHNNAVLHGWWEDPRTFGEIISLCHSELSEALEEFRAKRGMVWYKCDGHVCDLLECEGCETRNERIDKPEGIAVELADCIIRILDWFGKEELDPDALMEASDLGFCDVPRPIYAPSLGDSIARWHLLLSLAYACWCRGSGTYAAALRMALCVKEIMDWAAQSDVDMESILATKHAYNQTRPWRHGGKAL